MYSQKSGHSLFLSQKKPTWKAVCLTKTMDRCSSPIQHTHCLGHLFLRWELWGLKTTTFLEIWKFLLQFPVLRASCVTMLVNWALVMDKRLPFKFQLPGQHFPWLYSKSTRQGKKWWYTTQHSPQVNGVYFSVFSPGVPIKIVTTGWFCSPHRKQNNRRKLIRRVAQVAADAVNQGPAAAVLHVLPQAELADPEAGVLGVPESRQTCQQYH